jgi:hypothetical protein
MASLALLLGCGGGDLVGGDDTNTPDARADGALPGDGRTPDARPGDAPLIDAPPPPPPPDGGLCQPLELTAEQACGIALTGAVTPCASNPDDGWLEVRQPDGTTGYLCAVGYTETGGFYLGDDRVHLVDDASACCDGSSAPTLDWPATDAYFGVAHGPTHIKPWEMATDDGGTIRQNPFAVIVSNAASAAVFEEQRHLWQSWAGDGQSHSGYWFSDFVAINFVLVPTVTGAPLIIIGPEPFADADFDEPIGHPTLGACAGHGGAPLAFIGGQVRHTTLNNHSGRYGHEPTITAENLDNTAALFNCYGISITDVDFTPP